MSALDRLAAHLRIEPHFMDAAGTPRHTTPEVRRALIAAMGVSASTEREAETALEELLDQQWTAPLRPQVAGAAGNVAAEATLPATARRLRWSVLLESGDTADGETDLTALSLVARRNDRERRRIDLGALPLGYHRLRLEADSVEPAEAALIVVPPTCHVPDGFDRDPGVWGIAAQLYALSSARNLGIGDFTDLGGLLEAAAELGAAVVGVNPLHALFPDTPEHASPYSPASRLFLNVLYIDVAAVPEVRASPEALTAAETAARASRDAPLVDYARVGALKLALLEQGYERFEAHAERARREAFAGFKRERGEPLARLCRFQALREHFKAQDPERADWRRWPAEYRDYRSPAVDAFAARHGRRVDFHAWAQWLADRQLAAGAAAASLAIGLYRDLAVGADSGGAEAWSYPDLFVSAATAGAPPDVLNPSGQNWGLPPMNPRALEREAYSGFVELLRANMRYAGGLRIDHAMWLERLYWIPEGSEHGEGAYVAYPFEDLVGILALESRRARCLVVGEDLGTVPEGFRERMRDAGVFSYRVLPFEQSNGRLHAPRDYPRLALATIGSHDLATLRGWWEGRDIALKDEKGLYPDPGAAEAQRAERARERRMLLAALRDERLELPPGLDEHSPYAPALARAVHEYLARTNAWLAVTQLEDLTDEAEQANLPGTTDQYPNWRRKLAVPLEALTTDARVRDLAAILSRLRPAAL